MVILTIEPAVDPGDDSVTNYIVAWSLDDIETITAPAPSPSGFVPDLYAYYRYADDGIYTVTVSVEDEDGVHSAVAERTITVNNVAPTLALSGDAAVDEGSPYTLTLGEVTDPGTDTVTQYIVHWGDGSTDETYTIAGDVIHTYADGQDTSTITVDLVDEDGIHAAAGSLSLTVNNVAPQFEAGPDETLAPSQSGLFSRAGIALADPGADAWSASVDYGDGTFDPDLPVKLATMSFELNHSYTSEGSYNVTVILEDDDGGTCTDTFMVEVHFNTPPVADAGGPYTVTEGSTLTLDGSSSSDSENNIVSWEWDFDNDGTYNDANGPTPTITFMDNGSFNIGLIVTDTYGESSIDTATITVASVAPTVDAGQDQAVDEGALVSLSGSYSDPGSNDTHSFLWEVSADNGQVIADGTGEDFSFTPYDNGLYTATFTVADDDGASTSDTLTVTVSNVAPSVAAGSDQTVDEGAVVSLTSTFTDAGSADTHTAVVDWGDGETTAVDPAASPISEDHVYADNGTYTVTLSVSDDDGASTSDTLTITVNNVAPTVTADCTNQEVQYSDQIQEVSFSATDPSIDTMNAETSYSIDGGNSFLTSLPDALTIDAGLSFDGAGDQQTPATWTLSGIADLAPGTYIIRIMVTDDDGGEGIADTEIIVNPEDAISTYVGPLFVSTPSINDTIAIVELRAVIQDISFYPEDPDFDPNAGNITTSTVKFIKWDNGTYTVIAAGLPVQLIDPADSTTGAAIYQWSVDLGNLDSESFTVGIIVERHYSSPDEETVITVSKPLRNFITGGGCLINENSAGIYAGDPGLKTNFGFNVKFNKKLTNLQGKVNAIIRKDGRLYQIKTNATQSLVVDPINNTATFLSKANLKDITDPNNPIDLGGNLSVIVTLTDLGEPGTSDSISFAVWRKEALWFSSNWTGAQTIEQVLAGGNLVVHAEPLALHVADQSTDEQTKGQLITLELLEPVVEEAVLRWADYGIGSRHISTLQGVEFRIGDLAGSTIGLALGNTIWLDIDAAGYGWFIDGTPWDDAEFSRRNTGSELVAKRTSEAYGDIDLLTVVMHEMDHTLGFEDLTSEVESKDLMYETIQSGVRRTKTLPVTRRSTTHSAVAWHYIGRRQKDNLILNSLFSNWLRRYEELASRSHAH